MFAIIYELKKIKQNYDMFNALQFIIKKLIKSFTLFFSKCVNLILSLLLVLLAEITVADKKTKNVILIEKSRPE